MLAKRIIPCLDVKDGRTVKGVRFQELRNMGDPVEMGALYAAQGADELVYLDITATLEGRAAFTRMVRRVARRLDIPFTVGGGIHTLQDAAAMLEAGADKVTVNSAAVRRPALVSEIARAFGSQFVVAAIDARQRPDGVWEVCTHGGTRPSGRELYSWARELADRGAGEILFTSMDHDGTRSGYPCDAYRRLSSLPIPVIASGGAGTARHIADVLTTGGADAALAAGIFHSGALPIPTLKSQLAALGIPVRQTPQS